MVDWWLGGGEPTEQVLWALLLVMGDEARGTGLLEDEDFVVGFDGAFAEDFGDPAAVADDEFGEVGVPLSELATGSADVGDFDDAAGGAADLELGFFGEGGEVEAAGGEVFADVAVGDVDAFVAEEGVEFFAVDADGAVGAAVVFAVFLLVAGDALEGDPGVEEGAFGHAAGGDVDLEEGCGHLGVSDGGIIGEVGSGAKNG
jgi:hypothetical protein